MEKQPLLGLGLLVPKTEQFINCAMGLRHPIDVDALKKAVSESVMMEHPRFCSLLVRNHRKEYWRKTCVNIDDHFISVKPIIDTVTGSQDDMEAAVNACMANLAVSNPLSENKPLWEALGMVSCVKDRRTVIYGGKGTELWPRQVEIVKFQLQEFMSIKMIIPNATINDVLLGMISSRLSKYLHVKSPDDLRRGLQITLVVPVNLHKRPDLQELADLMRPNTWWCGSSLWGNKTSVALQPVHCCNGLHPLDHVKRMKAIMDQKKQSYEAQMAYSIPRLVVPCLGPKAVSWFFYRSTCNTTFACINIVGPSEELTVADNPVTYIRVNFSSAVILCMVSYAGKADLQVMVAKDIIPDSQLLVNFDYDGEKSLKSPFSRVYLCPKTEQIINCAMGLKYPIDVNVLKKAFSNSVMVNHPRFCSLMVRNHVGEQWRKTQVNIDDHFIIIRPTTTNTATESSHVEDDVQAAVNAYLADVSVSTPLSNDKPLWEVHVLMGLNCIVLRVHHALGDGASLMSMLSACFGKKRDDSVHGVVDERENGGGGKKGHEETRKWKEGGVWGVVKSVWLTLVYAIKLLGRLLWVKDETSVISGGDGVELWPRKLETVKFDLQDFKFIKKAIPNADLSELMRPKTWYGSSSWGNKTGLILQPVHCCQELHPLEHIKKMKATMDQKKQSYEAHIPYIALKVFASCLGPKVASWCAHRILCSTTMLISNIMGPTKEMVIAGNPVTYMRVNISSLPQALTIHMVSYAGKADLQVLVAKDIISDPELLAKCFQDSLLEMKNYIVECNK
ncbi:hypothetical protein Cgig2_001223 [Carnegiea gigantea]|uniref:Diacylglycerol O-acyltransferase n=1 Tax=Carnegiea gigantea TaxID=171969 RepID=A0A9Q1JZK6_9CARY|nr:hypothetical protein Cgig2_001223 [Carnegiea gigantea]